MNAIRQAVAPQPVPFPRPRPAENPYVSGAGVLAMLGRSREEAEATSLHADQTWSRAPGLGRLLGTVAVLGAAAWLGSRK